MSRITHERASGEPVGRQHGLLSLLPERASPLARGGHSSSIHRCLLPMGPSALREEHQMCHRTKPRVVIPTTRSIVG